VWRKSLYTIIKIYILFHKDVVVRRDVFVKAFLILTVSLLVYSATVSFASVSGKVTDTNGDPVSGALVIFTDESDQENYYTDYTDETGKYEILFTPTFVDSETPVQFMLFQNYPNPFNPTTTIPYSLEISGNVNLSIYNIMGQKVSTLADDFHSEGMHTIVWDGCDDEGKGVAAGMYLYRLTYSDHSESKKMLLIDGVGLSGSYTGSINTSSNSVTAAKPAKKAEHKTYCVTITGIGIERYLESGMIVVDGGTYDFIVVRKYDFIFVSIPAVTIPYNMSSDYSITLDAYLMSATEVTNAQYCEYLNAALASGDIEINRGEVYGMTGDWSGQIYLNIGYVYDSNNKCWINKNDGTFSVEYGYENWPVVAVTWYGSKAFAEYYGFDLPTEAQWQYAASGGLNYLHGTDDGTIDSSKANYNNNICHPVDAGSYPANPFGLFDMNGNVWELCSDWYDSYTYGTAHNPTGPHTGYYRVVRGGSWKDDHGHCRSYIRCVYADPDGRCGWLGFRIVSRTLPD